MRRMKAAVLHGKEDVRIEEVPVPRPGRGEVMIRTAAALTCGTDAKVFRRGYHARMIVPPALFGHEVAGVVEQVGAGVSAFAEGMRVVAANSAPCGACAYCGEGRQSLCEDLLFWNGAYAEHACFPARIVEKNLLHIPDGVAFEHAALVEPLACALRGVEDIALQPGQTVAIVGAGPMGLMLAGLAFHRGAHVVSVGRSSDRLREARAFGAAETVSLTEEPRAVERLAGMAPHAVIEAVGASETSELALRIVRKGGVVNLFGGCPADTSIAVDAPRVHYDEIRIVGTFHHTPRAIRAALQIVAEHALPLERLVRASAGLQDLPALLDGMARGVGDLKTAIRP